MFSGSHLRRSLLHLGVAAALAAGTATFVQPADAMQTPPDYCSGTRGDLCHSDETCAAIPGTDFSYCVTKYYYWIM